MSVQIIITGEDAGHALIELTTFSAGLSGGQATTPEVPKTRQAKPKPESAKEEKPSKPVETEKVAPEPESEPEVEEVEDTPPPADDEAPVPDDVELRKAASAKGDAGGAKARAAIKALLTKYGVSNLTAVPKDKRIAFLAELDAI